MTEDKVVADMGPITMGMIIQAVLMSKSGKTLAIDIILLEVLKADSKNHIILTHVQTTLEHLGKGHDLCRVGR